MKEKLNTPERGLRILFAFFTLAALIAAVIMPDRAQMFAGLKRICMQSGQTVKSYFDTTYGGFSGTFLNLGLVCLVMTVMYCLPKVKPDGLSALAFFLTAGFCTWGMTILNIWFGFVGVIVYAVLKKKPLNTMVNAMFFSTGLSPLITEMLFNYPTQENWCGVFTVKGILIALAVGCFIGFFVASALAHSPKMHLGYDLYSAGVTVGLIAFFLRAVLYKAFLPTTPAGHDYVAGVGLAGPENNFWTICNVFCFAVFGLAILYGLAMGGGKKYISLLKDTGYSADFVAKYGVETTILNFGIYGLFIVLYYNLVGAVWNGATLGVVFCMVCCFSKGSHPRNVWPIMAGYVIMSFITKWVCGAIGSDYSLAINSQGIIIGLCFANGLSPIAGRYGWPIGIAFGMMHYLVVTCTPVTHGSFSLYNGGFTAGVLCMIFMPFVESTFKTVEERKAKA